MNFEEILVFLISGVCLLPGLPLTIVLSLLLPQDHFLIDSDPTMHFLSMILACSATTWLAMLMLLGFYGHMLMAAWVAMMVGLCFAVFTKDLF